MFKYTSACVRGATEVGVDGFGNPIGEDRPAVSFEAAFAPPTTQAGSRIVDGVLRESTVTKPTLYVDSRVENAAALIAGAIRSGDTVTVAGEPWEVDGDPALWQSPYSGHLFGLAVELRRTDG